MSTGRFQFYFIDFLAPLGSANTAKNTNITSLRLLSRIPVATISHPTTLNPYSIRNHFASADDTYPPRSSPRCI